MTRKILAVIAASLLSSVVFADDDKAAQATFKAMDSNRDERLSQNEVSGDAALAQHFAALDRNADGYLTKREYAAHTKDENRNTQEREY